MPSNAQRSKAAAVATPRSSLLVDNISRDISNLTLNGPQAREPSLWFIPEHLPIPECQNGENHGKTKPEGHIPRPRNAYFLFRSQLFVKEVLPADIAFCNQNGQVSRIAGRIWKALSNYDKERFYDLAEQEKRLHKVKYPEFKITARNRRSKDQPGYCPIDESSMTPEEITCKRIAEIILQNIQGEELVTRIRDAVNATTHSGLFNPVSISALSRRKTTPKGDMDFNPTAPNPKARPVQKGKKCRTNKPRAPPKIRSSSSKKNQSKSSMKPPRAVVIKPSRRETSFSDYCWSEDSTMHHNTSYSSSEVGLPSASVISDGVVNESSVDASLCIPYRPFSLSIVGDVGEQLLGWDVDGSTQKTAFDQESPFEAYKDVCDTFSEDAIFATMRATDQSPYHGAQYSEAAQMTIGESRFTCDLIASPEPLTISPEWLV